MSIYSGYDRSGLNSRVEDSPKSKNLEKPDLTDDSINTYGENRPVENNAVNKNASGYCGPMTVKYSAGKHFFD